MLSEREGESTLKSYKRKCFAVSIITPKPQNKTKKVKENESQKEEIIAAAEKNNSVKYPTMAEVVEELRKMTDIGFPIAAMALVGYVKTMILVMCMGWLGSLELAGGSLAIGFTNISGYSVLSGLAMGMDPICSQAFGSKNFSLAFLSLQRTVLILLLASLPITFLWINLETLMLFLNQNPEISRIASLYCHFAVPDLVINSLLIPLRIYLRNKGVVWPLMYCTIPAIFLHIPFSLFLTFSLDLGIKGLAISTFVTNLNTLLFLLFYLFFSSRSKPPNQDGFCEPLSPFSSIAPRDEEWSKLIKLSLSSCLAVCLEWWWYELMTIFAGYLHNPRVALATSGIVIQTTSLLYTLPTALSASVSTRVGYEIGAGRPEKARLAAAVGIGVALLSSVLGLSGATIGREAWGRVFTKDEQVLELTMAVLPIIGLCEVGNCPQTTGCGVLRGIARPGIGAGINFGSFYLVGGPVAVVLAFVWEGGFVGLCYGLLAAQVACVVAILSVVCNTDWEKESIKARDLVGDGYSIDGDAGNIQFLKQAAAF